MLSTSFVRGRYTCSQGFLVVEPTKHQHKTLGSCIYLLSKTAERLVCNNFITFNCSAVYLPGLLLADHALRHLARFQGVIEAKATDVRVCSNALNPRKVLYL